jgi:CheY-like chemotaxis protein
LLVEDNPTDVFVIREVVEECGLNLRVRTAGDGQDALRYLQEDAGDDCSALILLDLNLPKISGFEVLRRLRQNSPCDKTPVIVVTSATAEADRADVHRLGAQGYFQKPNSLQAYMQLTTVIKHLLGPAESPRRPTSHPHTRTEIT